jgi:uncharacterized protein (TIGR02058 family)
MSLRRAILEMGAGTDLHGKDYTKAALRAVDDALHHSSLTFVRTLGLEPDSIQVLVTIGVAAPDQVDPQPIKAAFPIGQITVNVVHGGLDVPDDERDDTAVIASAAIDVRIETP